MVDFILMIGICKVLILEFIKITTNNMIIVRGSLINTNYELNEIRS